MTRSIAQRRYSRSMLILLVAYVSIMVAVDAFFRSDRYGMLAYMLAALPALPVVGLVIVMGRYLVSETDDYLRMKFNQQVLVATGLTLIVVTVWGFLERFGQVDHVDAYWAAVLWFFGFGVPGRLVNRLTFGEGGC